MARFFADAELDEIYNLGVDEATMKFVNTLADYRDAMSDMGLSDQAREAADMVDAIMSIFDSKKSNGN
jgi:hypothetical protein